MNCEQARERWHRRFDDGVADDAVEEHIAHCPACREYDAQMRQLARVLDELREDTHDVSARGPSVPSPGRGQAGPPRWRFGRGMIRVAAMIALIVTGSFFYVVQSHNGRTVHQDRDDTVSPVLATGVKHGITLQGDSAHELLAVARPITQPNVKVYWLYPSLPMSAVAEDEP